MNVNLHSFVFKNELITDGSLTRTLIILDIAIDIQLRFD